MGKFVPKVIKKNTWTPEEQKNWEENEVKEIGEWIWRKNDVSRLVAYLKERKDNMCEDCKIFISKFKPWDDGKVPDIAVVQYAECKKCKMTYSIFEGMVWPIPLMSLKEEEEFYNTEEGRKLAEMEERIERCYDEIKR